ncbi:sigma-70 family RNA polymerase sigma factor [Candidatus Peregrinibacteria bacterium]|nr:sigma-70 family RNA polymerase sigma factor [Candidatus Peregrinibacteria bacterium]
MPVDERIDNPIEKVIIARMVFSADRENDESGEADVDLEGILEDLRQGKCAREERGGKEREEDEKNLLGKYLKGLIRKPPQQVNQEFRTALTAEAVRNNEKNHLAWGENVWEEVVHQLLRSWEDVQVYCYDHHLACPDLPNLFQEGGAIPVELEQRSLLYTQAYLRSSGWRGAGEKRETAEEWEASRDVRELLARPLLTFVESIMVLPPSLRAFLTHWVQRERRLPQREELLMQVKQQGVGDDTDHVIWLEDRHTEAKHLLILSNMRFVVYKAGQYRGKGIDVADLIQESALGLMEAAGKFEPHRGAIFMNFAADHILKAIRAEFAEGIGVVKLPHSEIRSLEKCERSLQDTLGRKPSPEELGEALSWYVKTVKRVQRARKGTVPLDTAIVGDEDGRTVGESLVDPENAGDLLEQEYHIILHDLLTEALKGLPAREQEIIILRHGLKGGPPYTLQQAADILHLTRQRVHQLESCGEARLIRIIARRFPHLLPEGMTLELAMELADQKDCGKKTQERKKKARIGPEPQMTPVERGEAPLKEDGVILLERAIRWAFLTHTGIASTYYAVLREQASEVIQRGGTFTYVQRALQEKIDALAMRSKDAVS